MAQTIIRLVIMIFLSALFLMLALYSTTFKARAKRSFMVYEIVAIFLIIGDHNLILGILEFIIYQIIIIFSAISCLYAYAEIEINEQKVANNNCTALIKIPLKKQNVEVDRKTINSIQELALSIFIACVAVLIIIRPTILFPFYGRNAATFIFGILITIITFYVSLVGGSSRRAIETDDTGWETSFVFVATLTIIAYGFVQLIGLFVYMGADEKAMKDATLGVPASYGKMLPINSVYDYKEQIPRYIKESDITEDTYLIQTKNDFNRYYYCLYAFDEIQETTEGVDYTEVYIHLIEGDDKETRVDIYPAFYLNPRGEEDIAKYVYHFYIKEEQIITY